MLIQRSPDDDLADTRELSYAGAIGFNIWDEKYYSIANQPLFVKRNIKAYRNEQRGESDNAEALYRKNIEEGNSISHCYERLAIIYRKQKRYNDEVAILEKHLSLGGPNQQKVSERLEKAKQLKQGIRVVKTKEERIEAKRKKATEIEETNGMYNADSLQRYKESGVVTEVQILCSDDNKTCVACREVSGKRFSLSSAPNLPYNKCTNDFCRCTYLPVVDPQLKL
jgi:SPP1 gp7 family putative phage head morphogenesis protein